MLCYFIENHVTHIIVPFGISYWVQFISRVKFERYFEDLVRFTPATKREKKKTRRIFRIFVFRFIRFESTELIFIVSVPLKKKKLLKNKNKRRLSQGRERQTLWRSECEWEKEIEKTEVESVCMIRWLSNQPKGIECVCGCVPKRTTIEVNKYCKPQTNYRPSNHHREHQKREENYQERFCVIAFQLYISLRAW